MFIPRHPVSFDITHSTSRYEYELASTHTKLAILRDPTRSDLLTPLGMSALHVYDHGLRIGADPVVCAWGLKMAARANTAAFVFSDLKPQSRSWLLGDEPPFTFSKLTDESSVHSGRWMDAVQQSIVSRQHDCLRQLIPISFEDLSRSSTRSADLKRDFHYVEQDRVLAQAALDPDRKIAADYILHAAGARPAKSRPVNRQIAEANVQMVEALDSRDARGFNTALVESLRLRAVAFGKLAEEYKQNHTALWPLPIIALAVLAHDRRMPVEVESDYLPAGWVNGEVFTKLPVASLSRNSLPFSRLPR